MKFGQAAGWRRRGTAREAEGARGDTSKAPEARLPQALLTRRAGPSSIHYSRPGFVRWAGSEGVTATQRWDRLRPSVGPSTPQ